MKIKIKNIDLIKMNNTLMEYNSKVISKYFSYVINKNLNIIKDDIQVLKKLSIPPKEYVDFEKIRRSICEKYSEKDDNGSSIFENNSYAIKDECIYVFQQEIKELIDKNKQVVEDYKNSQNEFNNILEKEVEYDLEEVGFDHLPDEISPESLNAIMYIVVK